MYSTQKPHLKLLSLFVSLCTYPYMCADAGAERSQKSRANLELELQIMLSHFDVGKSSLDWLQGLQTSVTTERLFGPPSSFENIVLYT